MNSKKNYYLLYLHFLQIHSKNTKITFININDFFLKITSK